jgi:hypothetical protein
MVVGVEGYRAELAEAGIKPDGGDVVQPDLLRIDVNE